jgi:hypothetical protein
MSPHIRLLWKRSQDGYVDSKDGRFSIYPQPMGTTRAQAYQLHDNKTGKRFSTDTQAQAKREAARIVEGEIQP